VFIHPLQLELINKVFVAVSHHLHGNMPNMAIVERRMLRLHHNPFNIGREHQPLWSHMDRILPLRSHVDWIALVSWTPFREFSSNWPSFQS